MNVEFIGGGCRDGLRLELCEPLAPRRLFPVPTRHRMFDDDGCSTATLIERDVYLLERPADAAPRYRWIAREGGAK